MTDLIGKTVAHYRIDGHIGDGGMGNVYRAYDLNDERTVALKVVHPEFANQPEFRARITQEATTAKKLVHRGIVDILEFGEADGFLYMAMEYVAGGSLRQHLRRLQSMGRYLPFPQALQIGAQLAEALDYAHKHNAIHRDVKPSNVLLKRLEQPHVQNELPFSTVLTDFGLVKVLLDGDDLTKAGTTLGTPTYMAPEQCEGKRLDGRSDVYSLGVVLYEMMTNRLPFEFKTLAEAVMVHRNGKMPILARDHRPDVPPIIDSILNRALAKEPDDRFLDGAEMASALRRAMLVLSSESAVPTSTTAAEAQAAAVAKQTSTATDLSKTDVIDAQSTPPDGFELIVSTTGQPESKVSLGKSAIAIGRATNNDVILPVGGVSRNHAQLLATKDGWAIMDLGGINGTYLNNKRLPPNQPVKLPEDGQIRISAYNLMVKQLIEEHHVVVESQSIKTPPAPAVVEPVQTPVAEQAVEPEPVYIAPAPLTPQALPTVPAEAQGVVEAQIKQPIEHTMVSPKPPQLPVVPVPAPVKKQPTQSILELVEPLIVQLPLKEISVIPGETVSLPIDVYNYLGTDNQVTIRALGLPPEWLNPPQFNITVPAKGKTRTAIEIHPPRRPEITSGRQRVRIEVESQTTPHSKPAANASINVDAFESFSVRLEPDSLRVPKDIRVYVTNEGNSTGTYSLMGYDQMNNLKFTGQRGRLVVEPGKTASVELGVEQKNRDMFGDVIVQPFGIEVTAKDGNRQVANGSAEVTSRVPKKALYFIPPLLAACCLLGIVLSLWRAGTINIGGGDAPAIFDGSGETLPDATDNTGSDSDELNVLPSSDDGSTDGVVTIGDRDGDGLKDEPEGMLGTDPDSADSDGDGLTDGEEVFTHGTKPMEIDTDGDSLTDGDEVNLHFTNPQSADTDSDGIDDAVELSNGTNPNRIEEDGEAMDGEAMDDEAMAENTATPETEQATISTPAPPLQEPTAELIIETATPPSANTEEEEEDNNDNDGGFAIGSEPDGFSISCTDIAPSIDGTFQGSEWGNRPFATYQLAENPSRIVNVYAVQDFDTLYIAAIIGDTTIDPSDTLYIFFDSNGNGGDPDEQDRLYTLPREGNKTIQLGAGTNSDGDLWSPPLDDAACEAEIGSLLGGQWLVEMTIFLDEFDDLGEEYGLSMQSFFADEGAAFWPFNASLEDPNTWQLIADPVCDNGDDN